MTVSQLLFNFESGVFIFVIEILGLYREAVPTSGMER
jgi:hypothetical protein